MAFIPVPNAAKVVITTKVGSRLMSNVLHISAPGPFDQGSLQTAAQAIRDWWHDHLAQYLSTGCDLVQVQATGLDTNSSPQATVAGGTSGTLASVPLPLEVCACITLYGTGRGRSFRGRIYQPGLTISQMVSGGVFDGGVKGNLEDAYNNLIATLEAIGVGIELVVVSTHFNKAPRVSGIFSDVSAVIMRTLVPRAQRRRENDH